MREAKLVRNTLAQQRNELLGRLGLRLDALAATGNVSEEDQASLTHEEFISTTRNRIDFEKLQDLNGALRRLEEGEYGVCAECGEEIAPKRLKAIPWAKYCIHCQDLMTNGAAAMAPAGQDESEALLA